LSTTTPAGAAAATRSQHRLLTRGRNSSSSVTRLESQLPRRSSSGTSPIHGATAAAHGTDEDQRKRYCTSLYNTKRVLYFSYYNSEGIILLMYNIQMLLYSWYNMRRVLYL
jgi:hypothetical protein